VKVNLSEINFEIKFVEEIPLSGRGKLNVVFSHVPAFTRASTA
jgi:hypothetical protein